jgi:hypothetical protein
MKIFKITAVVLCAVCVSCTKSDQFVSTDPLFETVPNLSNCSPGSLSEVEKQKVLNFINSVRTAHKLPAVVYDGSSGSTAQEAALIGAANANVTEPVTETDLCYIALSEKAAKECNTGNRSFWGGASSKWPTSETHIIDWLTGSNSENINSRRRILDPFADKITFGRVIGTPLKGDYKYVSSAILMISDNADDISSCDASYIAYPEGTYSTKFFDPNLTLSFSVLCDKTAKLKNGTSAVDFSNATVEVNAGGSQVLSIVEGSFSFDNTGYGLPNNLQWKIIGLTKNVTYTVKISGVKVSGQTKEYEYSFVFK